MRQIGIALLGLALWTAGAGALQAKTLPTDVVRVIRADENSDWKFYDKKFAELTLDVKTVNKIKAIEAREEMNPTQASGPYRFRLTNLRIFGDQVQTLIFRTDLGDTVLWDLDGPIKDFNCFLTFSGNGFSKCSQ